MRLTSKVKVDNRFPMLKHRINEGAIPRALTRTAKDGAAISRSRAQERSRTGAMADIKVTPPRKDTRGWIITFVSATFYSWFHELGTRGSRRRKLRQPSRARLSREPGTGIKPLYFMSAGRRVARANLFDHLQDEMRRIP